MSFILHDPATVSASLEIRSDARAAGRARRFAVEKLGEWGCAEIEYSAELICSELATNAVVHGRTGPREEDERICLVLTLRPGAGLLIQVADNSSALPLPRVTGPEAVSGRGLRLVAELADAWASWPNSGGSGKRVWVYLRLSAVRNGALHHPLRPVTEGQRTARAGAAHNEHSHHRGRNRDH
ncbi:ATP-binding protein [Wenjunlia tyrosinilytica]|nr:ATP-binding protein [Wenjunlia tyrosinilytica]